MLRVSLVGLLFVLALQGCAATEQPTWVDPPGPGKVAVLGFAEGILQERFPHAYQQHKPFTAEAVPNTMLWKVYPVSGVSPGAPIMTVRAGDKMQVQSFGLQK